jgi:hypothetical protein
VLFDLTFQFGGVGRCGIERDVTACDERFDVAEAEFVKERPKVIHFDSPAADVDGAQERDVTRNGAPPEMMRLRLCLTAELAERHRGARLINITFVEGDRGHVRYQVALRPLDPKRVWRAREVRTVT